MKKQSRSLRRGYLRKSCEEPDSREHGRIKKDTIVQVGSQTASLDAFGAIVVTVYAIFMKEYVRDTQLAQFCPLLLLSHARTRTATDDKDKGYATLGLVNLFEPSRRSVGLARYEHPAERNYMDLSILCIRNEPDFAILSRCYLRNWKSQVYSLPS